MGLQLFGEPYSQNKPSEVLRKAWHGTPDAFGGWREYISGTKNTWAVRFREAAWALQTDSVWAKDPSDCCLVLKEASGHRWEPQTSQRHFRGKWWTCAEANGVK